LSLKYGTGRKVVIGTTNPDFATLKIPVVEGKFPDYTSVIAGGAKAMSGGDVAPLNAPAFNPEYVKLAAQIGKVLESPGLHAFLSQEGTASVFTFGSGATAALYIMPIRSDAPMSEATFKMLAPALRGTVAALKAHITRARNAEDEAKKGKPGS